MLGGIGESTVADGARGIFNQVDNILGAVHVACTETEIAFAQHGFTEIRVGTGIILPADYHDALVSATRHLDPEVGPFRIASTIAIYLNHLLYADVR